MQILSTLRCVNGREDLDVRQVEEPCTIEVRARRFVEHASGVVAIAAILALGHLHATYITDPTSSLACSTRS